MEICPFGSRCGVGREKLRLKKVFLTLHVLAMPCRSFLLLVNVKILCILFLIVTSYSLTTSLQSVPYLLRVSIVSAVARVLSDFLVAKAREHLRACVGLSAAFGTAAFARVQELLPPCLHHSSDSARSFREFLCGCLPFLPTPWLLFAALDFIPSLNLPGI